ncbi:MAG TPA: biopolymer transporter ExbD [Thermoanaerobaculia bacterium]|nr:biopolymer transporter ExbD [Thermoanaerobaculia bacterium]
MLTLPALRHSYYAAVAAPLLVILMAAFVIPYGSIICYGYMLPRLPRFAAERQWFGAETDLFVSVRHDATLFVGNECVSAKQLPSVLRELVERDRSRRVVVRIDRYSPFGATRDVMRALQQLGIRCVLLDSGTRSVAETWQPR